MKTYVDSRVELLPVQQAFLDYTRLMRLGLCPTQQVLWMAGARGGKTWGASYAAFEMAMSIEGGGDFAVAAPTWTKCKEVMKPAFMHWAAPYCLDVQDRFCWLPNGVRVCFIGMHRPAAIDGFTLVGGWGDEIKDWKPLGFQKACERTITTGGKWIFTSTPEGYNWIYDEFEGKRKGKPGYRFTFRSTTYDGFVDAEAVDDLAATMDEKMYRQQILGEYVSFEGQIHWNYDRKFNLVEKTFIEGREFLTEYQPHRGPVALFMDFNVDPMTGGLGQAEVIGNDVYISVFDEIYIKNSNTQEFLDEAFARCKKWGIPKNQLIVYPDPAGKHRSTTGKSDYFIIKDLNKLKLKARNAHPAISDRINAVNRLICDNRGKRHIFINPRCENLNTTMEQHRYKEGTNTPDKETGLDHMADGFGYWIELEFPVNYLTPLEKKRRSRGRKLLYNP
jgi:hypothetical protein